MVNLSEKILKQIESKKLSPKSKWVFILKNYIFWFIFIVFLFLGSLSFAVIIYMFKVSDWSLYLHAGDGVFEFFLLSLPYFWFLFLILFIILAFYNFKYTKRAYRYGGFLLVFVSILISIFLGTTFYALGMGEKIDIAFSDNISFYHQMREKRARMWLNPEKGFLAGTILNLEDKDNFILNDLNGQKWTIDYDRTELKLPFSLYSGEKIKIFGEKTGDFNFKAEIIRPLFGGRKRLHHFNFK